MDLSTSTSDAQRLSAAIHRIETALAKKTVTVGENDISQRHEALVLKAQAALDGLDRLLSTVDPR